jgi:transcriptional regulator with XRE-family HTH domain
MNISQKIKLIRIDSNLTQNNLAKLLNSGLQTIKNYECGYRKPNYAFMQKLCNKFPEYSVWLMTDNLNDKEIIATRNLVLQGESDER